MRYGWVVAVLLAASGAAAGQKLSRADSDALWATPEKVADLAGYSGLDDLDPILWVTTRPFQKTEGADIFLRGGIVKKTGERFYQVYIAYEHGRDWFRPRQLTFMGGDGLKTIDLSIVSSDVNCARYGCRYYEDAIAKLSRADLEEAGKGGFAGNGARWQLRMFGDTVDGVDFSMLKTEARGFLLGVDQYATAQKSGH